MADTSLPSSSTDPQVSCGSTTTLHDIISPLRDNIMSAIRAPFSSPSDTNNQEGSSAVASDAPLTPATLHSKGDGLAAAVKRNRGTKRDPALSQAERLEKARERNREHARLNRRRKKQKLEMLQRQVNELLEQQAKHSPELSLQLRLEGQRKESIASFLRLRSEGCTSPSHWQAILVDTFELTLPITPYRDFPKSEALGTTRIVRGVGGVIMDQHSINQMLQSLVAPCRNVAALFASASLVPHASKPSIKPLRLVYSFNYGDLLLCGDRLMMHWSLSSQNLVEGGAPCEITADGMLRAEFVANGF